MKSIVVINGSPTDETDLNQKLEILSGRIHSETIEYNQIDIRKLEIHHCSGCWTCWNKTPGVCIFQDDMTECYRKIIHADLLMMASPLILGYPTAIMKRFMDRLIPLVHPYIEWENGECHHIARYDHYPRMALYLEKESSTDFDDINIVRDLFARAARNLKSELAFTFTTTEDMDEVCNEINRF
jgi:multimeric flavodoxin WrbA